jgi:hypothetical protein
MDDLDLIRGFRRDVHGPSEDAKRRAAARLADAIKDAPARKPRVPVLNVRLRRVGAVLAVVVAAAAALFISTPWKQSPGFLTRAEAALTPPAATVLHTKTETTYSTKEFACTVTRGPTEYWIDQAPRHQFRATNEFLPTDPSDPSAIRTVGPRATACTRGTRVEIGGKAHEMFQFVPPNTLRWTGLTRPAPLDIVASLREALAAGHAHHDGETQLDGRTVERIRWDAPADCPISVCNGRPSFAYVDPETLYPIRIDGYLVTVGVPGRATPIHSDTVLRFLTYEYLPRTAANLALTDIHAQHPDATEH